jgi:hypothetical protein
MAGFNGIAWFEIGTADPVGAEKFYGESSAGPSGTMTTTALDTRGSPPATVRGCTQEGWSTLAARCPGTRCSACW